VPAMSLHSTLLHLTDTSFATLKAWKPVAYVALNLSFHHPHCQLCPLNQTELAICSGLAVPIFEALCIREVSWA
jgi:N-dimethylarginine dimethylaminohydrolase